MHELAGMGWIWLEVPGRGWNRLEQAGTGGNMQTSAGKGLNRILSLKKEGFEDFILVQTKPDLLVQFVRNGWQQFDNQSGI